MPSFDQVIVWMVVGLIGGSLAGLLVTWKKQGLGWSRNLGLGLAGALVGGYLFRLLGLFPGLDSISVSLRDIVAAVVGSFIVLGAIWLWRRDHRYADLILLRWATMPLRDRMAPSMSE
jgi:uncharacterized membrane protein YeaQ/YmgE (transglycosylase-associated protein family)